MYKQIGTLVGVVMVVTFITVSAVKKYFQTREHQNDKEETHNKGPIFKKRPTLLSREGRTLASLWNSQRPLGECNKPFKSSPLVPDEEKQDMNVVISRRFIRPPNVSVLKIRDQKNKCHDHLLDDQDNDQYNDEESYYDKYEEIYANGNLENREGNSVCHKNFPDKKSGKLIKCSITDEEKSEAANYLAYSFCNFEQMLNRNGYDIEIPRP